MEVETGRIGESEVETGRGRTGMEEGFRAGEGALSHTLGVQQAVHVLPPWHGALHRILTHLHPGAAPHLHQLRRREGERERRWKEGAWHYITLAGELSISCRCRRGDTQCGRVITLYTQPREGCCEQVTR